MIDPESLRAIRARVELELSSGARDLVAKLPPLPPLPGASGGPKRRAASPPPRPPEPAPSHELTPPTPTPTPPPPPSPAPAPAPPTHPPPPLSSSDKRARLTTLASTVATCARCPLGSQRTQAVFARGDPDARLMFVGEGPGADEDRLGEPFVGRAGQLLDRIVDAMGLARDAVYIANVVKCRPPGNRVPTFEESSECFPYLREQVELVRPEVLVALGATAARALLGTQGSMASLRGRWHEFQGTPLLCTYHPAYLLRNPADKRKVWEDMQIVMKRLGLPLPPPKGAGAPEGAPGE